MNQSWITPIIKFLEKGEQLDDPKDAGWVRIKTGRFSMIKEELYKQSYGGLHLKCLTLEEGRNVMFHIHEGMCGNHSGGRSLGQKVNLQGYF